MLKKTSLLLIILLSLSLAGCGKKQLTNDILIITGIKGEGYERAKLFIDSNDWVLCSRRYYLDVL